MQELQELKKQKYELIGWYKFTKDKAIRKQIRELDKKIRKMYDNCNKM